MNKLRIIFLGTPDFVIPVLKNLDENFNLVGVVSGPDQVSGRKKVLTPTPVKAWALENAKQALVFTPEKLDENFVKEIIPLEVDLLVVAAYGKIIPQSVLDIPKFGALNIHPSLLPKYRGASPIQSTILAGEETTGLTIIKMDAKMDHGPIVYRKEFELLDQDNFQTLHNKLFHHAAEILSPLIKDFIDGKVKLKTQNDDEATFCNIIKKADGFFEIDNPPSPEVLDRMIRAFYPWPTAWTYWWVMDHGSRVKKIIKFFPEGMVQMEGKSKTSLKDFLRGHPDFPIKTLTALA